jgi:hypothetical protein
VAEQLTLDGRGLPLEVAQRVTKGNPLLPIFGEGPEGVTCRSCRHLYRVGGIAKHVLKCDLRRVTSGEATDHRAGWPSCGRYEEGREDG